MANETVVCTYRVRPDAQEQFEALLARHWLTLHTLGLVTDDRSQLLRHTEDPTYVEIFTWVDGGFGLAHEHPDVLAIWEQMDPHLEERDGLPKWEFPHYFPLEMDS
jgi:hypothetical protein